MSEKEVEVDEPTRDALRLLAESTRDEAAPVRVEWALRAAFRDASDAGARPSLRRRAERATLLTLGTAAAAILALSALLAERASAPASESAVNLAETRPAEEASAGEFVPVGYADAELDSAQVVRVELPRASLVALGWPASAGESGERVTADVMMGHDGVARAIRLVQ